MLKKYKLKLNDQNMYCYIIEKDKKYSVSFDGNISFLNYVTKVNYYNATMFITIHNKPVFALKNSEPVKLGDISSTEVRAIYEELEKHKLIENKTTLDATSKTDTPHTKIKTELHTHLIEILSSIEFLNFLSKYHTSVPISEKGIDFIRGVDYNIDDIFSNEQLLNLVTSNLQLTLNGQSSFDDLEKVIATRSKLLNKCVDDYKFNSNEESYDKCKAMVTFDLLLDSLRKLKKDGVEYSEISYSNYNVLFMIESLMKSIPKEELPNFRLLLSIDRERPIKDYKQSSKKLSLLDNSSIIRGADIMGQEDPIYDADFTASYKDSLYNKLSSTLLPLSKLNGSVLRLHSGEFADTDENTEMALIIIETICKENKLIVPPPEIRIGHGLHIMENSNLVRLLQKFKCIIEINTSSNYALSNVTDITKIPIEFYSNQNIGYVLSTDGGGIYSTSLKQESLLASSIYDKSLNSVVDTEKEYLEQRGR